MEREGERKVSGRETEGRERGEKEVKGYWHSLSIPSCLFCTLVIHFTDHILSSCKNLSGKLSIPVSLWFMLTIECRSWTHPLFLLKFLHRVKKNNCIEV